MSAGVQNNVAIGGTERHNGFFTTNPTCAVSEPTGFLSGGSQIINVTGPNCVTLSFAVWRVLGGVRSTINSHVELWRSRSSLTFTLECLI